MSRVIADGLSKRATATTQEAEDAVEGKYPDADGVHAAFNQYGLGVSSKQKLANLNHITEAGLYYADGTTLNTPTDFNHSGPVIHEAGVTTAFGVQHFTAIGSGVPPGKNRTFIRHKDSGVWEDWHEIFHTGNILGTVSQSAGVPTGAVIERGSNANGEYTKFADGTLICTIIKTVTIDIDFAVGQLYRSITSAFGGSYPATFINSSITQSGQVMADGATDSNSFSVFFGVDDNDLSVSTYRSCLLSPISLTSAVVRGRLTAIGRWF